MLLWKIYFGFISFIILVSAYYQFVIGQSFKILDLANFLAYFILLLGTYAYIFRKNILTAKNWKLTFKGLIGLVVINLIYQILPTSYVGDFSFLNGSLLTNIFVYILILCFFAPLYYAVYQLSFAVKANSSKKKK
jgi:hypothetical protein